MAEQRRSPRTAVALDCTLTRPRGNPVRGRTRDLGTDGMLVVTERPLAIYEEVGFDLVAPGDQHRDGRARVLREQGANCYALRFEAAVEDILDWVSQTT